MCADGRLPYFFFWFLSLYLSFLSVAEFEKKHPGVFNHLWLLKVVFD